MSPPVSRLRRLTLEDMPPRTRSQSLALSRTASTPPPDEEHTTDLDSDDEDDQLVQSPTRLTYRLDELSDKTKSVVRDVFSEPPKIAIEHCRRLEDTYAFQMTELVTHSVRIRASDSERPRLSCSCGEHSTDAEPCEHILWLLDQLLKQTLYSHDHDTPVTMTSSGYAMEMGDPFRNIANYHLNILADGLHCRVVDPASADEDEAIDVDRAEDSRELLSSLYGEPSDEYRPDFVAEQDWDDQLICHDDLEHTIFRMLLDNPHFFHYFLSNTPSSFSINDPFRRLSRRVDRVLRDLDIYSSERETAQEHSSESPQDVTWVSQHLLGIVRLIRYAIYSRQYPLTPKESISAARTLVHILDAVVKRNQDAHSGSSRIERNLYLRLIGDRDDSFVVEELRLIPAAASQFVHNLEDIQDKIGTFGAPATYVDKLRKLISTLRATSISTTLKRGISAQEEGSRGAKRMK